MGFAQKVQEMPRACPVETQVNSSQIYGQTLQMPRACSLGSDAHPSLSPDGTKIAFISDREGELEIFIMNSDGTNAIRLTSPPFSKFNPSFSPDGTHILFSAIDGNDSEIWLVNTDGSNPVNLTNNSADDRTAQFNSARDQNCLYERC